MKKAVLALTASLAVVSGANAAWDPGTEGSYSIGNGELLLSIYDPVNQHSYSHDLGIRFDDIRAGTVNTTIALDPAHLAVFGGDFSNVRFDVFAASNRVEADGGNTFIATNAGIMYSLQAGQTPFGTDANTNVAVVSNYWGLFQQNAVGIGFNISPDENPVTSRANGAPGYAYAEGEWSHFWEFNFNRRTSGTDGETIELWLKGFTQDDGYGDPLDLLVGHITLNLTGEGGPSVHVAAVPIPAAGWLLGSALLGLGGIARRRRSQA